MESQGRPEEKMRKYRKTETVTERKQRAPGNNSPELSPSSFSLKPTKRTCVQSYPVKIFCLAAFAQVEMDIGLKVLETYWVSVFCILHGCWGKVE